MANVVHLLFSVLLPKCLEVGMHRSTSEIGYSYSISSEKAYTLLIQIPPRDLCKQIQDK